MKTLDYHDITNRVLNNIGENIEGSGIIKSIREDIADSLIKIFAFSESPRKELSYNIQSDEESVNNFTSGLYVNSVSYSDNFVHSDINGLELNTDDTGAITIYSLSEINSFTLYIDGYAISAITFPTISYQVLSESGSILQSGEYTWDGVAHTEGTPIALTFSPAIKGINIKLAISINTPSDWTKVLISKLTISKSKEYLELDDSIISPTGVIFRTSVNGAVLTSNQMTPQSFVRWNPNPSIDSQTLEYDPIIEHSYTHENLIYDGSIGYYFEYLYNKTRLYIKPKFNGIVSIYSSVLPTLDISDTNTVEIRRLYVDLLISSVTIKQLQKVIARRRKEKSFTEIEFISLRTLIQQYSKEYDSLYRDFRSWNDRNSEDFNQIIPNDFYYDPSMDLL